MIIDILRGCHSESLIHTINCIDKMRSDVNKSKNISRIFFVFAISQLIQHQKLEHAGAELCQAQQKLGLAKFDLPIIKMYLTN